MSNAPKLLLLALLPSLTACQTDYVARLGLADRDAKARLGEIVAGAREVQLETQVEFQQAYGLFDQLTRSASVEELEPLFDDFQSELEDCAWAAQALTEEITSIETHAGDLFAEWEAGLALYANPALRDKSAAMLVETRERVDELLGDLNGTRDAMQPVLSNYGDYALFFHHNLNVAAIATLKDTLPSFVQLNAALIGEIESDVQQADEFEYFLAVRNAYETLVVKP